MASVASSPQQGTNKASLRVLQSLFEPDFGRVCMGGGIIVLYPESQVARNNGPLPQIRPQLAESSPKSYELSSYNQQSRASSLAPRGAAGAAMPFGAPGQVTPAFDNLSV